MDESFRPKNQPDQTAVEPLTVKALTNIVSDDLPDLTLCPVRALERYIKEANKRGVPVNDKMLYRYRRIGTSLYQQRRYLIGL